jgi:hypothetical protein
MMRLHHSNRGNACESPGPGFTMVQVLKLLECSQPNKRKDVYTSMTPGSTEAGSRMTGWDTWSRGEDASHPGVLRSNADAAGRMLTAGEAVVVGGRGSIVDDVRPERRCQSPGGGHPPLTLAASHRVPANITPFFRGGGGDGEDRAGRRQVDDNGNCVCCSPWDHVACGWPQPACWAIGIGLDMALSPKSPRR